MSTWIFDVLDKDGIVVRLSQDRWDLHITVKHPDVAPYLSEIQEVINAPNIITQDSGGGHHLSRLSVVGGKFSRLYLEVVVRYDGQTENRKGNVLTVHFNARPPKGEFIWMKI